MEIKEEKVFVHRMKNKEDITIGDLMETCKNYYKRNKRFPSVVYMELEDYLFFPALFREILSGSIHDGWFLSGVIIKPYYES